MAPRRPAYLDDGFTPAGPRAIRCRYCGLRIHSNALARGKHRQRCVKPTRETLESLMRFASQRGSR